jgi:hypothetical protein
VLSSAVKASGRVRKAVHERAEQTVLAGDWIECVAVLDLDPIGAERSHDESASNDQSRSGRASHERLEDEAPAFDVVVWTAAGVRRDGPVARADAQTQPQVKAVVHMVAAPLPGRARRRGSHLNHRVTVAGALSRCSGGRGRRQSLRSRGRRRLESGIRGGAGVRDSFGRSRLGRRRSWSGVLSQRRNRCGCQEKREQGGELRLRGQGVFHNERLWASDLAGLGSKASR